MEVVPESSQQVTPDSKGVRFDVYARDGSRPFDVEMQTTDSPDLPQRSQYYNSVMDLDQIYKDGEYSSVLPVYIIFICTFRIPYGDFHRYTFRRYCVEDRNIPLKDGTEIIFFSTKGTADDLDEPMRRFLDYVDGKPGAEDGDEKIRQLHESVKLARMNKEWKREYMTLEMMIKDREREAVSKAKTEMIDSMIREKLSDEIICRVSGASQEFIEERRNVLETGTGA